MPLVAPHDLFHRAYREHWALGAFNTSNLEITQAIIRGLQEMRAPGIIQTSEAAIAYAGLNVLRDMIRDLAEAASVPIVLHLDHGRSIDMVEQCLAAGYGSVMLDGSALPLEANIALTERAVELAHARGVWVEGEVGAIAGKEGLTSGMGRETGGMGHGAPHPRESEIRVGTRGTGAMDETKFTDPAEAATFVLETGVDALAVSVGTLHGAFRGEERIRFPRLRAIREKVPIPLVLHGGSGLPAAEIKEALTLGIAKVNIDTELREAFHDTVVGHREDAADHSIDPRKMLAPARDAVMKIVADKVALLGSAGKA